MQLRPYAAPQHAPFFWSASPRAAPEPPVSGTDRSRVDAVVLIHGFPGTPAEMRPLGELLYSRGITVHAPLLPGFGSEIATIGAYRWDDWLQVVIEAIDRADAETTRVALVGNSMGAALVLLAAQVRPVTALALISPFWRAHQRTVDLLFPLARPFLKRLRPFRKADFSQAELRASLRRVLGDDVDLDDPAIQSQIRELPIPVDALAQVRNLGRAAYRVAPQVTCRTVILQGRHDPVAHLRETLQLAARLPNLAALHIAAADHDLIRGNCAESRHSLAMLADFLVQPAQVEASSPWRASDCTPVKPDPVNRTLLSLENGNAP